MRHAFEPGRCAGVRRQQRVQEGTAHLQVAQLRQLLAQVGSVLLQVVQVELHLEPAGRAAVGGRRRHQGQRGRGSLSCQRAEPGLDRK